MIGLLALWACPAPPEPMAPEPRCTDITWEGFARPFFASWCTSCHHSALDEPLRGGAPTSIDLDTYEDVLAAAPALAASATTPTPRMPPGGGTSPGERERLAEWLACGLPRRGEDTGQECTGTVSGPLLVATGPQRDALCASGSGIEGDLQLSLGGSVPCLCTVAGSLVVSEAAPELALPALTSVEAILSVAGNPGLQALSIEALEQVGGLHLTDNPELITLDLSDLSEISGDLIVDPRGLAGPLELDEVRTLGGSLTLIGPPQLDRLGLARLELLQGDLRILGGGIASLTTGPLPQIPGDLEICDTTALQTLEGLDRIERVGGDLILCRNQSLSALGLSGLRWIGGDLVIEDNPELPTHTAQTLVSRTRVDGAIVIEGNL
ncbi:MAG TPA: hypothetical protein ENK18_19740 [Deltaproteobacteria bacterium]|nr:hypothetical protein [Deltaproteobacteria bacterium]